MTVECANLFTSDGRLRGSYVYMLLCQIEECIHIKIGRSCTLRARLTEVPEAQVISLAEVVSLRQARRLSTELHDALARWHLCLEWFTVLPSERGEFNAAWRPVIDAHSTASRRIHWRNYSLLALRSAAQEHAREQQRRFMRRGRGFQDFRNVKHVSL